MTVNELIAMLQQTAAEWGGDSPITLAANTCTGARVHNPTSVEHVSIKHRRVSDVYPGDDDSATFTLVLS